MYKKKNRGITIVSLVITIILLLILAGISIQALTNTGLFEQALTAKEKAKISDYEEALSLSKTEAVFENNYPGAEQKSILERMKNILSGQELFTGSDYEIVDNTLTITTSDGYVFEVTVDDAGDAKINYISKSDKIPPIINITATSGTTNTITVTVTARKNEGGRIEFYIAKSGENYSNKADEKIEKIENNKEYTYTFENLEQEKTYKIKVVAIATNKQEATAEIERTTGNIPELMAEDIKFAYDPKVWTNGDVKVTAKIVNKEIDTKRFTLRLTRDIATDATEWATATEGLKVSTNGEVYAVLVDNKGQIGKSAATGNVQYIDTKIPVANITSKTTNSITFTGTDTADTAKGEQASKVAGYMLKTNNTKPSATDSGWQAYDGTSKKVSGLKQGNTYYLFVKDNAGNVSNAVSDTTGTVTGLTQANVTFTYSPSGWTNGSVKVTATLNNMTSSYTLKITDSAPTNASKQTALGWANASTGITVTTNKMVYAVLVDNEGQIGDATTGNVQYIDTKIPVASITSKTTNSITFTGTDTADTAKGEQASKVAGYMLKTNNTKPSATDSGWQAYDGTSKKVSGLKQGNTYYLFVKDNAGNVSNAVSDTTGTVTGLTQANVTFTYSPSGWTNGSVKVTATLNNMTSSYTLKITDSAPTNASKQTALGWANASTGITVTTNKMVYAVLVDNEGQIGDATTGNVQYIDTKIPVASITSKTTNSITFTGTDTADTAKGEQASKVAGYMLKTNNTKPSATDSGWQAYDGTSKKVSGLKQGNTYYLFVKDNAGNVSNAVSDTTGSVTISKGNIISSVTGWNGTTATVKFTTSTGYYIQTSTDGENWTRNPSTTGEATTTATTGTTVYARLTDSSGQYNSGDVASITPVLTYTISFNGNGATSGTMSSLTSRAYGTSYRLTSNAYSIPGYNFKGWNTKADGSGTSYANGASVKNLTTTNGATVTLYAQWELAEVWANEVSFKPSDSSWDATNVQEALDDLLK